MTFDMSIVRQPVLAAAMVGFCVMGAGPASADAGGGGSNANQASCPPGQVYDPMAHSCVTQRSEVLPDKALTDYAALLAKKERYAEALDVLNLMKDPNTPEALNYRGYATRKLGRIDEGIGYYRRSIALDPHYAQVREYLGEAYVLKGDLAQAKAQLGAIKGICGTDCPQYEHLAMAITSGSPRW